jgi:integrase
MPRKSTWPPPIKYHSSTGLDRCWVKGRGWVSLGPSGSEASRQAYARLVAELSADGAHERPRGAHAAHTPRTRGAHTAHTSAHTVSDVLSAWLLHPDQGQRSAKELEQYRLTLRVVERLYGGTPATEFRVRQFEAVQLATASGSWMTDVERARYEAAGIPAGCSARVTNQRVVRLRTVWRWAEAHDLVPAGSYTHLLSVAGLRHGDRRARHNPSPGPATWDDTRAVARRCPLPVRAMLILQWWAGMRSGEVRLMRAGEVDTGGDVWLYRPPRHKTAHRGQGRTVALGPKARAVLAPWLRRALASPQGSEAFVFPPEPARRRVRKGNRPPYDHRRCYSEESYPRAVRRAAEAAGVAGFRPYATRHAAADRIRRLAGADAARAVLGQRHISTTQLYGSIDAAHAADVQRRLG